MRIGEYDGESDLTAFLSRFERVAQLYRWSDQEQIIYLETSLKGAAADIVYEVEPTTTIQEMKEMLRLRFGTEKQGELSRTELQHTRRQPGEPLQQLYRTIKKLMSVGYPGPSTATRNWIGRDHFLRALNDGTLSVQVSILKPQTLEEALTAALELEALGVGREGQRRRSEPPTGSTPRDRTRPPRAPQAGLAYKAAKAPDTGQTIDVEALVKMVSSWTDKKDTNQPRTSSGAGKDVVPESSDPPKAGKGGGGGRGRPATRGRRPQRADKSSRADDICGRCQKKGHWKYECPDEQEKKGSSTRKGAAQAAKATEDSDPDGSADDQDVKRAHVVTVVLPEIRKLGGAVYLRVRVEGKLMYALLDTGCEHSLIGSRCLPRDVQLEDTTFRLVAANGTRIPLRGKTKLQVATDSFVSETTFLVSDNVNEMILGIDWLNQEDCEWSFRRKSLVARGHVCQLFVRNSKKSKVRRIYAQENVTIPARQLATVSTRIVWSAVGDKEETFIVEPKELNTGVMITRTMFGAEALESALPVINLTENAYVVREGDLLGTAKPAEEYREISPPEPPPDRAKEPTSAYAHVQPVIDGFTPNLTADEKEKATAFVQRYADLFSKSDFDIGRTDLIKHTIDTGDKKPFKQQLRRHPWAHQEIIDKHVEKMLTAGVIEPTVSPWASNVVLVRKPSGELRFCVDYRQLNNLTVKDSYPLPRIDSCLDSLGGAKYFSTLDLRSGYWQIEADKDTSEKTRL